MKIENIYIPVRTCSSRSFNRLKIGYSRQQGAIASMSSFIILLFSAFSVVDIVVFVWLIWLDNRWSLVYAVVFVKFVFEIDERMLLFFDGLDFVTSGGLWRFCFG